MEQSPPPSGDQFIRQGTPGTQTDVVTHPIPAVGLPITLAQAIEHFNQYPMLPVVDGEGCLVALFDEGEWMVWVEAQVADHRKVGYDTLSFDLSQEAATEPFPSLSAGFSEDVIRESLLAHRYPWLPLVDEAGRYSGAGISRRSLFRRWARGFEPPRVGGMATPFGVYLTQGHISTGPGLLGLCATGAMFAAIFFGLDTAFMIVLSALQVVFPSLQALSGSWMLVAAFVWLVGGMLVFMRLTPMAGLHAAEHMTIGAIEQGLPLELQTVRQQPRQHRRCGTNLMAILAGLEFSWLLHNALEPTLPIWGSALFVGTSIFVLASSWRAMGYELQTWFTTKPPTDKELLSGIQAGQALMNTLQKKRQQLVAAGLSQQQIDSLLTPVWWQRLWGSGLLQILIAYLVSHQLLSWAAHWAWMGLFQVL